MRPRKRSFLDVCEACVPLLKARPRILRIPKTRTKKKSRCREMLCISFKRKISPRGMWNGKNVVEFGLRPGNHLSLQKWKEENEKSGGSLGRAWAIRCKRVVPIAADSLDNHERIVACSIRLWCSLSVFDNSRYGMNKKRWYYAYNNACE